MRINRLITNALKSLSKNKSRSFLTALGIIIGVAAFIIMVGIGKGAQKQIEESISSLGTNMIMIMPGSSSRGGVSRGPGSHNQMTFDDVEAIKENANSVMAASAMVFASGQAIGNGQNWNTTVYGVDPDYTTIRAWDVETGEMFSERDVKNRKKVAILGRTVVDELWGEDASPIGERIRIRNIPFTVIGIMEEKGQDARGQDQDDAILVPSKTALYRLKGGKRINAIFVSAKTLELVDTAKTEVESILREEHDIEIGEDDDFRVRTQTEITEMASSTTQTLTLLLGAIAAVSLIVGGIGIMNIMLVSVTERTREIGIRMALGARESDMLVQFLTEAIVLSLVGGVIGIIIASGTIFIVEKYTSLTAVIDPGIVFLSILFSGAVGVFFGYYPARRASKLNPIDALRYE